MIAAPNRATSSALPDSARSPITGLREFVWTSSTGRVVQRDADGPQLGGQRPGEALRQPTSPLRPRAAIGGHSVNGAFSRATRPPSWSMLTQSGRSGTSRAAS